MLHELKTLPIYYDAVVSGTKTFELRKNDRNFQAGDFLELIRMESKTKTSILVFVSSILYGGIYGLDKDYVILSIKLLN